jgi:hypothetical protein
VSPELGHMAFRLGMLIVAPCAVLLFVLQPGTAEHSITVFTLAIGVVFLCGVALLVRRSLR